MVNTYNEVMNKGVMITVVVVLLLFLGVAGYIVFDKNNVLLSKLLPASKTATVPVVLPTAATEVENSVGEENIEDSEMMADWIIYSNDEYGFKFSYPPEYQVLDDEENLYGWKNGLVLLNKGGPASPTDTSSQGGPAYNFVVQVWESMEEYDKNVQTTTYDSALIRVEGKGVYISLQNVTGEPELNKVIDTFVQVE